MASLNYGSSIKKFDINGDKNKVLCVNTTDTKIFKRLKETKPKIDRIIKDSEKLGDDMTADENIELLDKLDDEVKSIIDYIFNTNASEVAFGNASCLSICENGLPLFQNFMEALIDEIEKDLKKANSNISKYTSQVRK